MRNEKLVPMTLPDPRERQPFLPQPNGDNKLTAAMVPYYTGCVYITIEIKKTFLCTPTASYESRKMLLSTSSAPLLGHYLVNWYSKGIAAH